ncbi:nuclear pore complex protein Nup93-like [Physella acuta]|uniref:nuclear pore complex protein Nup93-like n=1 Tax=Physella acuta TaxID=109671 RepID=UPI0027DC8305|nr:nuclear pore complex protein Nup93-like [Physella acuta]XP_059162488.1 nuclear pore complex protein Nup93-like [Physella acuta]
MNNDSEGFTDLLQQAEQLTADMDSGTDLPHVERNLQQILEAGQRLLTRTTPASQDNIDVQASILLGSKGFVLPKISERLEGLRAATTFEPLEPVRDTDIEGFLRNERENALLAVIEQTRKNTFEEVDRRHWECMENEWEREKQRILNSLLGSGQESFEFQQDPEMLISDGQLSQGRSSLDNVEMAYARQVFIYNEHVIENGILPSLVDMFLQVANSIGDKNVIDLWELVQCMTVIPLGQMFGNQPALIRKNPQIQSSFVARAKHYLEESYIRYLETTICSNLRKAQLGGIPGTYNLVLSYLNVKPPITARSSEDGELDKQPVWALLFYCLRCGDLRAAKHVVERAGNQLGDFPTYFNEYLSTTDHRLGPGNDTKIKLQYRRVVKNCSDPYKRAVYCVIGRCDWVEDHTEILDKIDDYLWMKLSHIQEHSVIDGTQEHLSLPHLQKLLYEEYGESHFNGYQQPFLYFQVLFLTCQFEAAIEFLSRIERLRYHAVHVALVLYEMKMLVIPPNCQAQLLSQDASDPSGLRRLNLARLIMMYTRKFEATDAQEALQYFYFLRNLKTPNGEDLFMSCVSELVLETKEFDMLLGRLMKDGTRKPGAIDRFNQDTQKITELVAKETESKGLFEDAIQLYDLAKDHEKALTLMNKLLSQVVALAPSPLSTRERLQTIAVNMAERYSSLGHEATQMTTKTFYLLLDLLTFFDYCHAGAINDALKVMQGIQILPFSTDEVDHRVSNFKHYSDEVRRCLPDLLLATMNILLNQYNTTRNSSTQSPLSRRKYGEDGGKDSYLNYLRSQARSLIMFAGMLPYRLPGDTNARLVQIDVLMS